MAAPKKKAAKKKAAKKKTSRPAPEPDACALGQYDAEPKALPEGIDMVIHVIATYYISFP